MSLEVISVSEDLKRLGVTKIWKDNNTMQLIFNNQTVVIFEILPEQLLKTIENLKSAAKKESVNSATINKVAILLQDTPEYLEILQKANGKATNTTDRSRDADKQQNDIDEKSTETNGQCLVNASTELDPYIQNRDYVEYVVETAKKTIRREDSLLRLLIYVGLTAYSHNPLSIGIRAPTCEGKTYAVTESVLKFFPRQDVMILGSLSPKALIRQHGMLIDENNQPLEGRIKQLRKHIKECQVSKKVTEEIELQYELDSLLQKAKLLIDLQGKILLFLEPPHPDVWNIIKPILSHDAWEIEHPYVDADLKTKNVVTRGWPTCIFCSAKDESRWEVWPEIQSRFLITSPNMSPAKYLESNILTFQKSGLPNFVQQKVVVSDSEVDLARKCIQYLKQLIKSACPTNYVANEFRPHNPVWVPYQQYLAESLPSSKGPSMRTASHIGSLLDIIALTKSNFFVDFGIEKIIVARPEDLVEVLQISKDLTSGNYAGLPQHKIRFLKETFYPVYDAKTGPDSKDEKVEKIIGVTTKELCDYYRAKTGIGISTDNLKKQYLNELLSNDLIGELLSEIDKRQHIYYPLVENGNPEAPNEVKMSKLSNIHQFDNFLQQPYIQLPKNCKDIPENWLIFEILGIANCRIGLAGVGGCLADFLNQTGDLKFYDMNDINNNKSNRNDVNDNRSKRLTVKELIFRYESNVSIRHILKGDLYNFHSKIFGNMIGFCILSYNKPKILSNESKFDNFDISSGGYHPSNEAVSTPDYNNMQQSTVVLQQKAAGLEHGLRIRKELVEHLDPKVKCVEEFFLDHPGKADSNHFRNVSFQNCMLRIPGSYNSKCVAKNNGLLDKSTQIKVISQWNGRRFPIYSLIDTFYADLLDAKRIEHHRQVNANQRGQLTSPDYNKIQWIETGILHNALSDYRKYAIWRILSPYLLNVKKLPYEASYSVLKNWLDGCNKLRSVDFNINTKIKDGLRSAGKGYLPIGLQKLMIDNRKLYDLVLRNESVNLSN